MRLPGTRYQEHGWEHVRKMLGHCSLLAFADCPPARLLDADAEGLSAALTLYLDLAGEALRDAGSSDRLRAGQAGNSYGDSVQELAMSLVYELRARPGDWLAFCAAVAAEHARSGAFWEGPAGDAILRKKVNDMYAVLRDKVDSDNYQVACGRSCSPNKMYAYRMLDTAYGDIARLFAAWQQHPAQVGAILGRALHGVEPIETRQLRSIGACKPEWIIRWSESLESFGSGPGPLHTRSKRFASLKNSPDKIAAMLREIGDYEELSSNRDQDWLQDADDAAGWLEDLWRVCAAPEEANGALDRIQPPPQVELAEDWAPAPDFDPALALAVSLPPRYMELAWAAQDRASWTARTLEGQSLPVRLAVYLKILGPLDDCYPGEWLDPDSGALPTMQQLAALDQVSLPTLRKRRDLALAALLAAAP